MFIDLDYQGCEHQHRCQIDADNWLEVVVLVVVGAEADDVQDGRREEHVGRDGDQLTCQDELHLFHFGYLEKNKVRMNSTSTASVPSFPILTTWSSKCKKDSRYPDISILNPDMSILNPDNSILNPDNSILNPDTSILNPDMSILNPDMPIQIRQSWIQICQSWIQICQSWIQNFNPESRISILNPDMSILNMFEAKTFIFSSLISYFCITRGPRYLELKSAGKKQKHMWGWSRFKLFNIMWGWYTSNKSQSTFIVLKEGFISNRMERHDILLKHRVDHGGEGVIFDSHWERDLTALEKNGRL